MASYTMLQLKAQIGDLTGYEAPFVTEAEKLTLINSAISRLRIRLSKKDRSLFMGTDTINVVSGTESYDLPTGAMKILALWVLVGSKPKLLERINWLDRYRYDTTGANSKSTARYAIRNADVYIWPTPTWTADLYADFLPIFTPLADDDAFDCQGLDGWDQWVKGDVCTVLATKARDETRGWELMKAQAEEIMGFIAAQDGAGTRTVTDTYNQTLHIDSWRV